ncbi:flagellar basal body P-ring formation chaperone FlgA [Pectobacterium sp. B1J-3]|uniref:flagellar basal body P-ring formation chaperone FlgA n=1 Tax=Pectobacterium sp. B1J-3 TaxID=3385371 RepID=UPI0039066111
MKVKKSILGLLTTGWVLLSGYALAAPLSVQINQFFSDRFQGSSNTVKVIIKSPESQWPQCENPQISLPGNTRVWGNISVSVRCGQVRRFIQTEVQVTGHYVVSAKMVSRGTKLDEKDLRLNQGRLDQLPPRTLLTAKDAQGAVALRDLVPGQPITTSMLRRSWVIKAGQNVPILVQGEGFTVNSEGKAINNAAAGQSVRVRTSSGQIVSGTASEDGIILISQ